MVREIPIGKATILTILTLGIYYAIWVYRNSKDIHERDGGHAYWQLWFWLGFVTFFLTWIVLYVFNVLGMEEIRNAAGLPKKPDGWLAFGLEVGAFVVGITGLIAPFVWAIYSNQVATHTAGTRAPPTATPA